MLANLTFDLKYAWRLFLKAPSNSLLCILVVALSVGLSLFVYVIDYNIALKPLPFPDSQRWLSLQVADNATRLHRPRLDAYTYQEVVKRGGIEHLGAFSQQSAVLSEGQASTRLRAVAISPGLLGATKVAPQLGRIFDEADGRPGAARTVILSFDTWQTYFAADPAIVGKQTRIDGEPVQVRGVLPQDMFAFQDFELWFPLQLPTLANPGDSDVVLSPIVVVQADQSQEAALADVQLVVDEINQTHRNLFSAERELGLFPAHQIYKHGNIQVIAMATLIAVAVLLLGGVNISLIIFAMLAERSRELALRTALGSTRRRLLQQCLLQSAFVVLFGLALGCGLAALAVRWAHGLLDFTARLQATGRDPNELVMRPFDLLVAIAAALLLWLLSTLIPAWRLSKLDPAATLAGSGKGLAKGGSGKTASVLVGLQVVVSCLLLVICANVVLSVNKELSKPIGVATAERMISTYPTVFDTRYADPNDRVLYWDQLATAIKRKFPGADVAFTTAAPTNPAAVPAVLEDRAGGAEDGTLQLPIAAVSEDYFQILGIELRTGRLFDSTDSSASVNVAVVDERTAAHYWPGLNPIGQRLQLNPNENGTWLTVVGVVSAVSGPYSNTVGSVYQPLRQALPGEFQLLVKLPTSAPGSRDALRAAAFALNPDLPLHNLQMLDEYLVAINSYKSLAPGFSGIGLITLILAATGLFGLISRSVSQRTQEIGVLRALGSTKWRVMALFLRQALVYLCIGLVGGCLGIALTTSMSGVIPNVLEGVIPVTAGVFTLMSLVIFVSSYFPARRAVAMEPGDALRYE